MKITEIAFLLNSNVLFGINNLSLALKINKRYGVYNNILYYIKFKRLCVFGHISLRQGLQQPGLGSDDANIINMVNNLLKLYKILKVDLGCCLYLSYQ